jgi:hypothetical protein
MKELSQENRTKNISPHKNNDKTIINNEKKTQALKY